MRYLFSTGLSILILLPWFVSSGCASDAEARKQLEAGYAALQARNYAAAMAAADEQLRRPLHADRGQMRPEAGPFHVLEAPLELPPRRGDALRDGVQRQIVRAELGGDHRLRVAEQLRPEGVGGGALGHAMGVPHANAPRNSNCDEVAINGTTATRGDRVVSRIGHGRDADTAK